MRRNRLPGPATIMAAALLAGCGGASRASLGGDGSVADRSMVEFAHCMRAHGINVADPSHQAGHTGLSIELPAQGPVTRIAYDACSRFLKSIVALKERAAQQTITAAVRLGLIRYAECMRSHAVPMLDPNALGQLNLGNVPGISNGFGRYTPQFSAADHDCRHLLPPSVPDNGSGP